MHFVNLQFLLNILDILDIKIWNLKIKLSVRDSILGSIAFFRCQKHMSCAFFQDVPSTSIFSVKIFLCMEINDYIRYIPFYSYIFLSIIFS